jgi:predicted choloylglycine hydrolase
MTRLTTIRKNTKKAREILIRGLNCEYTNSRSACPTSKSVWIGKAIEALYNYDYAKLIYMGNDKFQIKINSHLEFFTFTASL